MNDTEKELVSRAIVQAVAYIASHDPNASVFVRAFEAENAELFNALLINKPITQHVRTIGFAPKKEATK